MAIPFYDLNKQYLSIKSEIDDAISEVLNSSQFSHGPFVEKFESNFSKFHHNSICIAINSGTSALYISLLAMGIGQGDEVIVPSFTFIATAEAVSLTGATPVFVDCDKCSYQLSLDDIKKSISHKTKAIIVVHLFGHPALIAEIKEVAASNSLFLIEDCSQSHLASYHGKVVGTFGDCGCFSFYPGKNLGAYGEAGAIITKHEELAIRMKAIRNHGMKSDGLHHYIGGNYRMDGIQAAILNVKLKHLRQWNYQRNENAKKWSHYLKECPNLDLPYPCSNSNSVPSTHLFVVRSKFRDELSQHLRENDIETKIHYGTPCHLQPVYQNISNNIRKLPNCEKLAKNVLSLPVSEQLTENEIELASKIIKNFLNKKKNNS